MFKGLSQTFKITQYAESLFYFHHRMHYIFAEEYIKIDPTCFGVTTILREHIVDLSYSYNY